MYYVANTILISLLVIYQNGASDKNSSGSAHSG